MRSWINFYHCCNIDMRLFFFIIWLQQIKTVCDWYLMCKVQSNYIIVEVLMFVINSINNDIFSLWEFEFSIDENIEFNKKFWNESKSNFDLRANLTNSKIFILLNFITYSILFDFSWFLIDWNAFEKRNNYDSFYVCNAHWMMIRERTKLLMFKF